MGFRELLTALVDLVLPTGCAGCGSPVPPWCAVCAVRLGPPGRGLLRGGLDVVAAGPYSGPQREALLRYKERGSRELAAPLAALLAPLLPSGYPAPGRAPPSPEPLWFAPQPLWLVPAPSRPGAARARGGDHVLRLCRLLAAGRPGVTVAPVLTLGRGVRDSVGLDAAQRAANLAGRMRVGGGVSAVPEGASVLLVDDVVTTGATLRACRGALLSAGVPVGRALVLCDAAGLTHSAGRPADRCGERGTAP